METNSLLQPFLYETVAEHQRDLRAAAGSGRGALAPGRAAAATDGWTCRRPAWVGRRDAASLLCSSRLAGQPR